MAGKRAQMDQEIRNQMAHVRRLEETQTEILTAMRDLIEHQDDTLWLTDSETVFERLAYLYEVAGGDRKTLVLEWPEYFDIDVGTA